MFQPRAAITRPAMELPPAEAGLVRQAYEHAQVILEYGSGGSTVMAAEMPGKIVFAVESDPRFLCRLNSYLMQIRSGSRAITYYVDIGEVGKWGHPLDTTGWLAYPDYSRAIWNEDFFVQPDTVLIDGRFRVACFMACAAFTRKPLIVLFDDYQQRAEYHVVESIATPIMRVGRMAVFRLKPHTLQGRAAFEMLTYLYDQA